MSIRVLHAIHAFSAKKGTILNTFIPNHGRTAILWTFSESVNHTLTSNQAAVYADYAGMMLVRSTMLITYLGGIGLKSRNMQAVSSLNATILCIESPNYMCVVDKQSLCGFFGVEIANAESSDEESTALCLEHYGALYRHLNPFSRKCRTCDKTVNYVTKTRKCPEPALIQQFLQQNMEFTGQNSAEDRVCYACYKAHLVTIKHMHNTTTSTDADLPSLLEKIKNEISSTSHIHTPDQAFCMQPTCQQCMLVRLF